jgi:hypothetical protein
MSKITQIERELLAIDQATFQGLCDAYLAFKGYNIKSLGSMKGQNKTILGTPDSFISLPNGKYIFVEYTTTAKNKVFKKFEDDLEKCFDTSKTGIPISEIEKIFLCYNSLLDTDETQQLINQCQANGCNVEFIDIDELKFNLYKSYPKLAFDFLGIQLDSLQILLPEDFISESERKATSLQNPFFSREKELEQIQKSLESNKIIIITGKSGVGKTRFVLQSFEEFKSLNPDIEIRCIFNKGIELYQDLRTHFLPNKKYLLLVDDANRISEFIYVARLTIDFDVRIVITVRDYAVDKIEKQLKSEKYDYDFIEIKKIDDKEIKNILHSLNISNPFCIDNITRIANGNPRLVLMSAEFALKENNCNKLRNVSDIYDNFFDKTLLEINELNDNTLLKVLGIICFFRIIDKQNNKLNDIIFEVFEIDENTFWESVFKLNDLELVDLYEKQIVKITDQVLAVYFFYYVFIKRQILDYSLILDFFLDDFSGKVKDNLYPMLNHFGYEQVFDKIKKGIEQKRLSNKNNEESLINFYEIFWFCQKEELILWLQEKISLMPDNKENYIFEKPDKNEYWNKNKYPYLELIKLFSHHNDEFFKFSLDILFQYAKKQPQITYKIIEYITTDLSFKQEGYNDNWYIQTEFFEFIFQKLKDELEFELYQKILLSISQHFLKYEFDDFRGGRKNREIIMGKVFLGDDNEIINIRRQIWEFLLSIYPQEAEKILDILDNYVSSIYYTIFQNEEYLGLQNLADFDKEYLIKFFEDLLDPYNYRQCKLLYDYLDLLTRNNKDISPYKSLRDKFNNLAFEISLILEWDYFKKKRDYAIIDRDDFEIIKEKEIEDYFKNYQYEDYINFFDVIQEIQTNSKSLNFGYYRGRTSIEIVFTQLAKKDLELCLKVIEELFKQKNYIQFASSRVVAEISSLIENPKVFYDLIEKYDFRLNSLWKLHFFENLPPIHINQFYVDELLKTYQDLEENLSLGFDFLQKYKHLQQNILVCIIQILLNKAKNDDFKFSYYRYDFFETYSQEFVGNLDLLKKLYFYGYSTAHNFDYNKKGLKVILEHDSDFVIEFLNYIYSQNSFISANSDIFHLDFIWNLDDYQYIITQVLEYFLKGKFFPIFEHFVNAFFPKKPANERVLEFIADYINSNFQNRNKIKLIFHIILYSYPEKRIEYLHKLISLTQEYELITELELISSSHSASGSLVPCYEADKKFWKLVENAFSNDLNLLKLKLWAKEKQKHCDRYIEFYLKQDFTNEY